MLFFLSDIKIEAKKRTNTQFSTSTSHLSRCLEPAHEAIVLAELVHFDGVAGQLPPLVALVGQQHGGDALPVRQHQFGVQVVLPLGNGLEGGVPRHVEHDEGPHGFAVVDPRHVPETFLTCSDRTNTSIHTQICS